MNCPLQVRNLLLKSALFLMLSIAVLSCTAQESDTRYLHQVFDDFSMQTVTYLNKGEERLQMDIYSPKGDTEGNRPVILYVHGGGFSGGTRDEKRYTDFCETMAKKGYVTITMSYTLLRKGKSFGCDFSAEGKVSVFDGTAADVQAATKYLTENARKLKINSEMITLAGSSAGAEAVLHAAYVKDTKATLGESFKYAGVISMAGAMINDQLITNDTAIPTQLFHGTCDGLVPYGTAPHHYCDYDTPGFLTLYGGKSIADRLATIGEGYYMVTGCNGGHEWNDRPMIVYSNLITDFMYHDVLKQETRQVHIIKADAPDKSCTDRGNELACGVR
ncbi:MAG: alpha/beta hydrolase [Roseivirga sp.]|nr:alpha/beta hydrolase [Roseivirga sp.]